MDQIGTVRFKLRNTGTIMKKSLIMLALAVAALSPTVQGAYDGEISFSTSPGGAFGGGPFTIDVTAGLGQVIAADGSTGAPGVHTFRTFCLEYTETIGSGTYGANLNSGAVKGGTGPVLNPDPISRATAWLYSQFRAGTLAASVAFYALGAYADDSSGNNALQQAIWWLEHETRAFNPSHPVATSEADWNNYLVATAVAATGAGSPAAARGIDAAPGEWGVAALNVYRIEDGAYRQDMLAIVPEPSTYIAGALLLIPLLIQARRWRRSN